MPDVNDPYQTPPPPPSNPTNHYDDTIPPPPSAYGNYNQNTPAPNYTNSTTKDWMGIVSLITSLLGMSLVAVIFGHLGLNAYKKGEASSKVLALIGTILGWGGIGIVLMFFIAVIVAGGITVETY